MLKEPPAGPHQVRKKLVKLTLEDSLKILDPTKIANDLKSKITAGEVSICIAANQNVIAGLLGEDIKQYRAIDESHLFLIDQVLEKFQNIKNKGGEIEDEVSVLLEKINGLRCDLAEIFAEVKFGNIASAKAAKVTHQSRKQVEARLTRLEENDQQAFLLSLQF